MPILVSFCIASAHLPAASRESVKFPRNVSDVRFSDRAKVSFACFSSSAVIRRKASTYFAPSGPISLSFCRSPSARPFFSSFFRLSRQALMPSTCDFMFRKSFVVDTFLVSSANRSNSSMPVSRLAFSGSIKDETDSASPERSSLNTSFVWAATSF